MGTFDEKLARLRSFNDLDHRSDPQLAEETGDLGRPSTGLESMQPTRAPEEAIALENIVIRRTRPVLVIRQRYLVGPPDQGKTIARQRYPRGRLRSSNSCSTRQTQR
jgi:hypothetical protein